MIGWYIAAVLYLLGSLQMVAFIVTLCQQDAAWRANEKANRNMTHILTALIGAVVASAWPISTLVLWKTIFIDGDEK